MIRAYIHQDMGMSLDISIVMHPPEGSFDVRPRILRLGSDNTFLSWDEIEPNGAVATPTLRIGAEEACAVLDALTRHFHGAEDTRALRRDYDAERGRVDKLVATVSKIADQATMPVRPNVFSQERP